MWLCRPYMQFFATVRGFMSTLYLLLRPTEKLLFGSLLKTIFPFAFCQDNWLLLAPGHNRADWFGVKCIIIVAWNSGCLVFLTLHSFWHQSNNLETRRQKLKAEMVYKSLIGLAPNYLSSKFIQRSDVITAYNLSDSDGKLAIPLPCTNYYNNSFGYSGAVLWNSLPSAARQATSLTSFWRLLINSDMAFM